MAEDDDDADALLLQYDTNNDGLIDFDEFRDAMSKLSQVDTWAKHIPWWQAIADALPRTESRKKQQLRSIATLTDVQIKEISSEAEKWIRARLKSESAALACSFAAMDAKESNDVNTSAKFTTFKAEVGNVSDFHKGLSGRVGNISFFVHCLV